MCSNPGSCFIRGWDSSAMSWTRQGTFAHSSLFSSRCPPPLCLKRYKPPPLWWKRRLSKATVWSSSLSRSSEGACFASFHSLKASGVAHIVSWASQAPALAVGIAYQTSEPPGAKLRSVPRSINSRNWTDFAKHWGQKPIISSHLWITLPGHDSPDNHPPSAEVLFYMHYYATRHVTTSFIYLEWRIFLFDTFIVSSVVFKFWVST